MANNNREQTHYFNFDGNKMNINEQGFPVDQNGNYQMAFSSQNGVQPVFDPRVYQVAAEVIPPFAFDFITPFAKVGGTVASYKMMEFLGPTAAMTAMGSIQMSLASAFGAMGVYTLIRVASHFLGRLVNYFSGSNEQKHYSSEELAHFFNSNMNQNSNGIQLELVGILEDQMVVPLIIVLKQAKIISLVIKNCAISDNSMYKIAKALRENETALKEIIIISNKTKFSRSTCEELNFSLNPTPFKSQSATKLKSLVINNFNIDVTALLKNMDKQSCLDLLDISNTMSASEYDLTLFKQCGIKILILNDNDLGGKKFTTLMKALENSKILEVFSVQGNKLTHANMRELGAGLRTMSLQKLDVSRNQIGDYGLIRFLQAIDPPKNEDFYPPLRVLNLSHCNITNSTPDEYIADNKTKSVIWAGLNNLALYLVAMKISILILDNNPLLYSDQDYYFFQHGFNKREKSHLKVLSLTNTQLFSNDLKKLAETLTTQQTSLSTLIIDHNPQSLSSDSLETLAKTVAYNPSLGSVVIDKCPDDNCLKAYQKLNMWMTSNQKLSQIKNENMADYQKQLVSRYMQAPQQERANTILESCVDNLDGKERETIKFDYYFEEIKKILSRFDIENDGTICLFQLAKTTTTLCQHIDSNVSLLGEERASSFLQLSTKLNSLLENILISPKRRRVNDDGNYVNTREELIESTLEALVNTVSELETYRESCFDNIWNKKGL